MSFLKVKRKCAEDPKEVFILASKKLKFEDAVEETPLFELTSTALQEEDINNAIKKTIENHQSIKSRKFDLEKIRKQMRAENVERARKNKFKILNYVRKIDGSAKEESVPIIDLCDDSENHESQNDYVYDLYYSKTCVDVNDPDFSSNYSIHQVSDELYIEHESEDEELLDDEDDSNDENNWRNDYPDERESSENSCNLSDEEYLCHKMRKTHVCSDYSLSSDEFDQNVEHNLYDTKCTNKNKHFDYCNEITSDSD